jgi:Leucine-rich repeat (LRR) protein
MNFPDDILLEVMDFLPEEDLYTLFKDSKLLPVHSRLRTAMNTIAAEGDLERARKFPKANYILFVYDTDLYSQMEAEEYQKVHKLYTSVYVPPFFENLRSLNISHTFIRRLPPELSRLTELNCSNTPMRVLPPEYTRLKRLQIDNTLISIIPDLYDQLEVLCIYSTRVRDLSPNFIRLKELNASKSLLTSLPETYTQLEKLNCKMSYVQEIPKEYRNLRWLDCTFTEAVIPPEIRELPLEYFRESSVYQLNFNFFSYSK